jgi:hypothetical protein
MYSSSKFKYQLSFNWHLNLIEVCTTQSWYILHYFDANDVLYKKNILFI